MYSRRKSFLHVVSFSQNNNNNNNNNEKGNSSLSLRTHGSRIQTFSVFMDFLGFFFQKFIYKIVRASLNLLTDWRYWEHLIYIYI
jgi:hypothetical protein